MKENRRNTLVRPADPTTVEEEHSGGKGWLNIVEEEQNIVEVEEAMGENVAMWAPMALMA